MSVFYLLCSMSPRFSDDNLKTYPRMAIGNLFDHLQLQRDFYASWAIEDRDAVKKAVAANQENTELFKKGHDDFKKTIEEFESKFKSLLDSSFSDLKWENRTLRWELDSFKEREKRRSKNRSEKRKRKKQRQLEARGLNHVDAEENEADEE